MKTVKLVQARKILVTLSILAISGCATKISYYQPTQSEQISTISFHNGSSDGKVEAQVSEGSCSNLQMLRSLKLINVNKAKSRIVEPENVVLLDVPTKVPANKPVYIALGRFYDQHGVNRSMSSCAIAGKVTLKDGKSYVFEYEKMDRNTCSVKVFEDKKQIQLEELSFAKCKAYLAGTLSGVYRDD